MRANTMTLAGCEIIADASALSLEEWKEIRREGIGGSDSAAFTGLSPYSSSLSVWLEKTGRSEGSTDNHRMVLGRIIEPGVISMLPELVEGLKAIPYKYVLRSTVNPRFIANIDALVVDQDGKMGVLEVKSIFKDSDWKDGFPPHHFAQVIHYMFVTGLSYAVIVGVGAFGVYAYRVERDENAIAIVLENGIRFWRDHIETDSPPAPSGVDAEDAYLTQNLGTSDHIADLSDMSDLIREYLEITPSGTLIEKRKKAIMAQVKAALGTASGGNAGKYLATVSRSERSGYTVAPTTVVTVRFKEAKNG